MKKFFIYCNSNQVYHALIHNAIYSSNLTRTDFVAATASFLSNNTIFITKEKLSDELKSIGSTDIYYPIILEIEVDEKNVGIPVRFVVKDEEIKVLGEVATLEKYSSVDKCIGAFIYGEIPFSFVSAIWFDNEQEKMSFRKSSPDLWFPAELFKVWSVAEEEKSEITKDDLRAASEIVNQLLTDEKCSELNGIIVRRNRQKAVNYYMVEATESWESGRIKANVDGYLIRTIDAYASSFAAECKKAFTKLQTVECQCFEVFLSEVDPVLEGVDQQPNSVLFNTVMEYLYCIDDTVELDRARYEEIIRIWLDALSEEDARYAENAAMGIIAYVYAHTEMDPDKALDSLNGYPVLKAFMFFLDQQKNGDFLRNTCKKLSPAERRYAYMMFGAYHGMTEVDGAQKKNRFLELHLEKIAIQANPSQELISELPSIEDAAFCGIDRNNGGMRSGIIPKVSLWYDCQASLEKLMAASDKTLEEVYKLMKDSTIPPEEIYALSEPVVVTISFGGKEQRFEVCQKAGIKGLTKDIERAVLKMTKQGEKFQAESFKKYLSDAKRYSKFFKRNSEKIQEICGRDK